MVATRVLEPFHVCKLGLGAVDEVRRRMQQDTVGRRGHKHDPLGRTRAERTIGYALPCPVPEVQRLGQTL